MILDRFNLSLRGKLVALIVPSTAIFLIGVWLYLPARADRASRGWFERRASGMALVLSHSVAPGLDFDDRDNVKELLAGLEHAPAAIYGVVRRADGSVLGAWRPEAAPPGRAAISEQPVLGYTDDALRVDVPVRGKSGVQGVLTLGFALDELKSERRAFRVVLGIASALIYVFSVSFMFAIATFIMRPVRKMTAAALQIASGELTISRLDVRGGDEIAQMGRAFNRMIETLQELSSAADRIGRGDLTCRVEITGKVADAFNRMTEGQRSLLRQIAHTAIQLGAAARQIQMTAQEQEAAATQQAGSVEEVSRTVQSLLESASHITESARGVLGNAERTKETTEATTNRVSGLKDHTGRIAELLEVIRDIADRSDLLALNASLEATRAGEAGRAFSLVAVEMRRLAERVTASVQDVKSLLADVRAFGTSTVMATEEGLKLAESTTESARQITMVTQQQRTATEQVLQSMQQISIVLTQTVGSAQETRTSVENLTTMAEELNRAVGGFRIDEKVAA